MPVLIDVEKDTLYKKGIEKGIERGIVKGIEKGEMRKQKEVVIRGYKKGISISILSIITSLSVVQVRSIVNKVIKSK